MLLGWLAGTAFGQVVDLQGRQLEFLAGEAAQAAVVEEANDPFFARLTPLDLEVRLGEPLPGVPREVALRRLKRQYQQAVAGWTADEQSRVTEACRAIWAKAAALCPEFVPPTWRFVKTDGTEEAGAAYTRGQTIVLSQQRLQPTQSADLRRLVAHETCHVFTRTHPAWRDRLYARLGFRAVGRVDFGQLDPYRLTNPDAPDVAHAIRVTLPTYGDVDAVVAIYAPVDRFTVAQGRQIFAYLKVGLFPIEAAAGQPAGAGGAYRILPAAQTPTAAVPLTNAAGFFDQVGRNTQYVIAPEEILAENLALLFAADPDRLGAIPNPEIVRDLQKILAEPPTAD